MRELFQCEKCHAIFDCAYDADYCRQRHELGRDSEIYEFAKLILHPLQPVSISGEFHPAEEVIK